jgi:hypothetical protein
MKQAYILNMAMHTLMDKMSKEQKTPESIISIARLERYEQEYKELSDMIIEAEKQA